MTGFLDIGMSALVGVAVFTAAWALNAIFARLAADLPEAWKESLDHSGQYLFGGRLGFVDIFSLSMTLGLVISVIAAVIGAPVFVGPIVILAALGLPLALTARGDGHYRQALETVMPAALQQVANEMTAGRSLENALETVAESAPKPADIELGALQRKVTAIGMERALEDTARKLQVRSFSLTASVLNVGSRQGGNLIRALKRLSATLVEIERMNRKIKTASAGGRRVLQILSVISVAFPLGWYTFGPQKLADVVAHPVGQLMLLAALIIWAIAVGLAIAFMRVKV